MGKKMEMAYLDSLIKQYDFINEARWGDDDKEPPTWEEVRDQHLSTWNDKDMSFEFWSSYMTSGIIAAARDVCSSHFPSAKANTEISRGKPNE